MNGYVELNRTFSEISISDRNKDEEIDIGFFLQSSNKLDWEHLLIQHRVIVLAEAGAGKTEEISRTAHKLKTSGKSAFFLRLEQIASNFETAFEIGTHQEFQGWLASKDEGWILLDSVDEARMGNPKDFEIAIKKISSFISAARERTHIIITSRAAAWRPNSDLLYCNNHMPCEEPSKQTAIDSPSSPTDDIPADVKVSKSSTKGDGFKVYALADLSAEQISVYAHKRGITNHTKFISEIDRMYGWDYARRPLDLENLISFWKENQRIGSHLELMEASIECRIQEDDQGRANTRPLSKSKAIDGARLTAGACVLMRQANINTPDNYNSASGINIKNLQVSWQETECQALLERPIFVPANYGTMRFFHRSAKEFLAAKWLAELIQKSGARNKIRNLFITKQYGLRVVRPSMKPILSWLVLFDDALLSEAYSVEPDLILSGGDPTKLPLDFRRKLLCAITQKIANGSADTSVETNEAISRFASADMGADIISLLKEYDNNQDVLFYLSRLVWKGHIKAALQDIKNLALRQKAKSHLRIAAIRAVKSIGSEQDINDIQKAFLTEAEPHDRKVLVEIIDCLDVTENSAGWLADVLRNTAEKEKHTYDGLASALVDFIERAKVKVVAAFVKDVCLLLQQEPFAERHYCSISKRHGWLLPVVLKAIGKLVSVKHEIVLSEDVLYPLVHYHAFREQDDHDMADVKNCLSEEIPEWKELNHKLFWVCAKQAEKFHNGKNVEPITHYQRVSPFGGFWIFNADDFDQIADDIAQQANLNNRLIALSLAFKIYKDNNVPENWLKKLQDTALGNNNLKERLSNLLTPPAENVVDQKWKKQEERWRRKDEARKKKEADDLAKSIMWLNENSEKLVNTGLGKGIVSQPQYYLLERMREHTENRHSKWAVGNWKDLIPVYGHDVAESFRKGAQSFWREYKPEMRSEKDLGNSMPIAIILGLAGLAIESGENLSWTDGINQADAEIACRYAFNELNGFPDWFKGLYERFPQTVKQLVLHEIDWELAQPEPPHYILSKVTWSCEWLWNDIAQELLALSGKHSCHAKALEDILAIVQKSEVASDETLKAIAINNCSRNSNTNQYAYWVAVWIGVDPKGAIKHLSKRLKNLSKTDKPAAKNLAMCVVVKLVGDRHSKTICREKYKSPRHLKDLYLLMLKHIDPKDDINRIGNGAYSPSLQDDAQDARQRLFSTLCDIEGKETFLAIQFISKKYPNMDSRSWIVNRAKERAEIDADLLAMELGGFLNFAEELKREHSDWRSLDFLELKPNFCGVGININELWHLFSRRSPQKKLKK